MSVLSAIVVLLAWLAGGILGGATGIGAVMVAIPIMSIVLPASDAILIACLAGVFGSAQLVWAYRKFSSWADVRDLLIGCIPGCLLGAITLKFAPMYMLQLMISFMLVLFILLQLWPRMASFYLPDSLPVRLGSGTVCGFVSSSIAMTGAPLGIYVLLRRWSPNAARGNMSIFYLFTSSATVIMQAMQGLYHRDVFLFSSISIASCFVGGCIGIILGRKMGHRVFRNFLLFFLAIAAALLFWRAMG